MMMKISISCFLAILMITLLFASCTPPKQQSTSSAPPTDEINWPTKPVRVIIATAAGGSTDTVIRYIVGELQKEYSQPFVVDNRPGGGTLVGISEMAAQNPDGYTIGSVSNSLLLSRHTMGATGIPYQDLDYIALLNKDPATLIVSAKLPYNTVEEFTEYCIANPGKVKFANAGANGIWHIIVRYFANVIGADVVHVPYDGANPAVVSVAGGHTDATMAQFGEAKAMLDAGEVKALAVMGAQRDVHFPNVPIMKEAGIDIEMYTWCGLACPKGVDPRIIAKMGNSIKAIMETEEYKKFAYQNYYNAASFLNSPDFVAALAVEDKIFTDMFGTK
jgi:tripartite-type tricarboxylate transporter receptor subunit TctC